MHEIKQFRPLFYLVLLMGVVGFGISSETSLWPLAAVVVLINYWLVRSGRFVPLPRWLASSITLLALLVAIHQIASTSMFPLRFVGQFLVFLQLVKLFEHRSNRDFAQMLVLSMLLMVAAAMTSLSLGFAAVLAAYVLLALYCCLLFHLKVEMERAVATAAVPADEVNPATLRQDMRYMPGSMRRLTVLVAGVSLSVAVVVFLFFPRGAGANLLGNVQPMQAAIASTGFSDQASFGDVARILQNNAVAAHVKVWRNNIPQAGDSAILLRGVTYDQYHPRRNERWDWLRSAGTHDPTEAPDNGFTDLRKLKSPPAEVWRQEVRLEATGATALFAMGGAYEFKPQRPIIVRTCAADETFEARAPVNAPITYEVLSTNTLVAGAAPSFTRENVLAPYIPLTRKPDVVGPQFVNFSGDRRGRADNLLVAASIERYFHSDEFTYSLDLSEMMSDDRTKDPVLTFLSTVKRGHCEYFASAMTLMCQSIGIPARMVRGFDCNEFNPMLDAYVVRQSHAHAWVEVLGPQGWVAFNPTSGRTDDTTGGAGLWASIKHFFDFLDVKWGDNVISYDKQSRENVVSRFEGVFIAVREWWNKVLEGGVAMWRLCTSLLGATILVMVCGIFVAIAYFLVQKFRLRRLARRIGLHALPADEQLRLARQLYFYDELTRLLERRRLTRPPNLTPMEFSSTLAFLPPACFESIRRLTRVFYKVRFGDVRLNPERQRRLEAVVQRIGAVLDALPQPGAAPS